MIELKCPSCGGEMQLEGYRILFPKCGECGKTSHVKDCIQI